VRSAEARRLQRGDAPITRPTPDRLIVTPTEAPPISFEDETTAGDLMRLHVFRGRLAERFAVLEVIVYDGGQFMLVDERTGETHEIDAMPKPSPDGARFVTASLDLLAGNQPNRLAVYRITETGVTEEWSAEPQDWGPSHVEWIDDATIRLRSNVVDRAAQPPSLLQTAAWLDRSGERWSLRR
jgi:hypothetical protein